MKSHYQGHLYGVNRLSSGELVAGPEKRNKDFNSFKVAIESCKTSLCKIFFPLLLHPLLIIFFICFSFEKKNRPIQMPNGKKLFSLCRVFPNTTEIFIPTADSSALEDRSTKSEFCKKPEHFLIITRQKTTF